MEELIIKPYSSFLVRCWDLQGKSPRIQIEHIQSGEQVCLRSLAALEEWIARHEQPVEPEIASAGDGLVFPLRIPAGPSQR